MLSAASKCVRCNYCNVCPIYRIEGWESVSPRGKLQAVLEMLDDLDAKIVKDIYKCSVCGLCEVVCPAGIELIDFWEELRSELVRRRLAPLSVHRKLREITYRYYNPYSGEPSERAKWLEFEVSDSPTLYFAGCTASFKLQNLAKSTASVLKKLGVEFTVAGREEYCCGSPFIRTGQMDIAKHLFEKNMRVWQRMRIERIITSCPGCYRTIARDYPKLAKELGYEFEIEVLHTVTILNEALDGRRVRKANILATYHDPCHLGRHMGMYEEPREVMKKLGIKLVEMERNRELALCCGAGGGLRSQFREISFEIGRWRVEEAAATGAEYLVTCCPFCEFHLSKSVEKLGKEIKVVDLVEIAEKLIFP